MFHSSQIDNVKRRIQSDLTFIDKYGSVKIYLCFYDDLLVSKEDYNGLYPCSDKTVDSRDLIPIIHECMTRPYILRTNDHIGAIPAGISNIHDVEKYIEVCLIYKMDSQN